MNPTDDTAVLEALDWDVQIRCKHRDCRYTAEWIVRAQPGPADCHTTWTPLCGLHERQLIQGLHNCKHCKETMLHDTSKPIDIKESK